ncbi:MAG: LytTR family DNA-binding domain-containing protein [Pseudodonghicola sp.]
MGTYPERNRRRGFFFRAVSRNEIAVWSVFSFLTAYGGPFGTYDFSFGRRLLYWSLIVVISSLLATLFVPLSRHLAGPRRRALADLILIVLMTVSFTPIVLGLTHWLLPRSSVVPGSAVDFAQFVAIITLGVVMTRRVIPALLLRSYRRGLLRAETGFAQGAEPEPERPWTSDAATPDPASDPVPDPVPDPVSGPAAEPTSEPEPDLPPRLARRLPEDFQGPILRLSSEDHFVDVITAAAVHRLRMRFADAIDEMDTVEGDLTHRSHWVARAAIDGVEREGGRIFIRLVNGDRVPVSRTYRPGLEQAGIL